MCVVVNSYVVWDFMLVDQALCSPQIVVLAEALQIGKQAHAQNSCLSLQNKLLPFQAEKA